MGGRYAGQISRSCLFFDPKLDFLCIEHRPCALELSRHYCHTLYYCRKLLTEKMATKIDGGAHSGSRGPRCRIHFRFRLM